MKKAELEVGGEYAFAVRRWDLGQHNVLPLELTRVKLLKLDEPVMNETRSAQIGTGYLIELMEDQRSKGWGDRQRRAGETMLIKQDAQGSKRFFMPWASYETERAAALERQRAREDAFAATQSEQQEAAERWNALVASLDLPDQFTAKLLFDPQRSIASQQDGRVCYATVTLPVGDAWDLVRAVADRSAQTHGAEPAR